MIVDNTGELKQAFHTEFGNCVNDISTDMQLAILQSIEGEDFDPHYHKHRGIRDGSIVDTGELAADVRQKGSAIDVADPVFWALAGSNCDHAYETHEIGSWGGRIEPREFVSRPLNEMQDQFTQTIEDYFNRIMSRFV